jgi:acyl carrier protein
MFEKVRDIIKENVDCGHVKIAPETDLISDLQINSLDLVELVCAFEVAFGIVVPEKDIRKLSKVNDIVSYLEQRV